MKIGSYGEEVSDGRRGCRPGRHADRGAPRGPAPGGPAGGPDEHGRGRRAGRADQGVRVQAGAGPGQRLGGLADPALRRAGHLGRLAVPGAEGRGGPARCPTPDQLRRPEDDRVPAHAVRREAGADDSVRYRTRRWQRGRALPAARRGEVGVLPAGGLQGTVAGEGIVLEEGDALTFTADMEHTFVVPPRAGRARVLWVLSPALPDHGLELPPGGSG